MGWRTAVAAVVLLASACAAASSTTDEDPPGPGAEQAVEDPIAGQRPQLEARLAELRSQPPVGVFLCIELWCDVAATEDQTAAVGALLEGDPRVRDLVFVSQEESYAAFVEMFADEPDVLDAVDPGRLPPSFRFDADPDADLVPTLRDLPGVEDVVDARDQIAELESLLTRPWGELAAWIERAGADAAVSVQLCAGTGSGCDGAASPADRDRLRSDLDADDRVTDLRFSSAEDNRARIQEMFARSDVEVDGLLDGIGASFSFSVPAGQADAVRADYEPRDGVAEVITTSIDDLELLGP